MSAQEVNFNLLPSSITPVNAMFTPYFWEKLCKNCFSSGLTFSVGSAKVKLPVRKERLSLEESEFSVHSFCSDSVAVPDSAGLAPHGTKITKAVQSIPKTAKKSTCLS